MILVLSLFFLVLILFVFGIVFSKVKIDVKKLQFKMPKNELCNNEYWINIGIYLFGKIKIFGFDVKNNSMKLMGRRINYDFIKNSNIYKRIAKSEIKTLDKKVVFDNIKNLYIKFEKLNLDLSLGTDNTLITSFLTFVVSTVISLIVQKGVTKYDPQKHNFIITPKYENHNLINIDLSCIISLRTINIIGIISYINKQTKEKNKKENFIKKEKVLSGV